MGKAVFTARGEGVGSSEIVLDLPDYDGPEITIAFDPTYLQDFLRGVDGPLTLEMTDGQKPAVFRAGETYLYLVMPLAG